MKNLIWLIGGILLGLLLSAFTLAGIVLAADAVWQSNREDISTLKNRQC